MTMESVDLSDVNSIVHQTIDNNDKGPVSLEQIHIEESEARLEKRYLIYDNDKSNSVSWNDSWWYSTSFVNQRLSETCKIITFLFH